MATFLFEQVVFGPVRSRRLGTSLGINLLPLKSKACSFDCLYCECGWTPESETAPSLPSRAEVVSHLEEALKRMRTANETLDSITFAGNGEPTLHPDFSNIIDDTIILRDRYYPKAQTSVLSNATRAHIPEIHQALQRVDNAILKLDAGTNATFRLINRPRGDITLEKIVDSLASFPSSTIVQTLFLRGSIDGQLFDNTSESELVPWIESLKRIKPRLVTIYSIARDTPANNLEPVSRTELETIATRLRTLGFVVQVNA